MILKVVQALALILIALALVPAGAHLFELPAKLRLAEEDYFTVQQIYRGWSLFGIADIGAIVATAALAVLVRRQSVALGFAAAASTLIALMLSVFFVWTYPANQATNNWTVVPPNWTELRAQWEYSHAASAAILFAALCCAVLSIVSTRRVVPPTTTLSA